MRPSKYTPCRLPSNRPDATDSCTTMLVMCPTVIRENAGTLNISRATSKKRRDDKIQPMTNTREKTISNALDDLQRTSSLRPRCCKAPGNSARNMAPNAVASKTDIRYLSISFSGPVFLRMTTTRPLNPANAIAISAIVVSDSKPHLLSMSQLVALLT